MKPFAPFFGLLLGISSTFWFFVGGMRFVTDWMAQKFRKKRRRREIYRPSDIAVIIPAHNEELGIRLSIQALKQSIDPSHIYVISDGSRDRTYQRARRENCHVSNLTPGIGKAKAILYTIKRHSLYERYKFIFIVDADTRIERHFIGKALQYFHDPDIGVVFGSARITWPPHLIPRFRHYITAYRERLNRMLTIFYIYGQTWKYTNVLYVIPGFAAMFRCEILKQLPIDTPGLLTEDFNTAFQLHKKRLCKVAFDPSMIGWDQPPETLHDYWRQVKRWNIGFFQTVRMNGIWPSFFWLTLGIFTVEIFLNSIFILLLPLLILYLAVPAFDITYPLLQSYASLYHQFGPYTYVRLIDIFTALFIIDYGLTVIIGLMYKKPQFFLYGLFFFFMHYVTSLILVTSIIPGFFTKSEGRWDSPVRSAEHFKIKV